jgi:hypothetical protein
MNRKTQGWRGGRTNEVSVLEIEAVELVAGLLGVGYVFIDNEGSTLGVVGDTLSNLATMAVSIIKSQSAYRPGVTRRLYSMTIVACRVTGSVHTELGQIFRKGRTTLPE